MKEKIYYKYFERIYNLYQINIIHALGFLVE